MENSIFRKKSLDRISSPEQLQDYMRVMNPGVWMVLVAVIVLLAGLLVCSVTGRIETTVQVECVADGGEASVALSPEQGKSVAEGMALRVAGREAPIKYVYQREDGQFIATAQIDLDNGVYDAKIVTESIAPISFLLND